MSIVLILLVLAGLTAAVLGGLAYWAITEERRRPIPQPFSAPPHHAPAWSDAPYSHPPG